MLPADSCFFQGGCWALKSKQIESVLGKSRNSVKSADNASASARPTLLVEPATTAACPAIAPVNLQYLFN